MEPDTHSFEDDGGIPNSRLPVLIYHDVEEAGDVDRCERLFAANTWLPDWQGDVLVLPAGTGHCNEGSSPDLLAIGAYPDGMPWDICRGDPAEHDEAVANIEAVPLPRADPVGGRRAP